MVTVDVNANEQLHTEAVTYLVYRSKLAELAPVFSIIEPEQVSVYPDLPCDGWLWYHESDGTAPLTDQESR